MKKTLACLMASATKAILCGSPFKLVVHCRVSETIGGAGVNSVLK